MADYGAWTIEKGTLNCISTENVVIEEYGIPPLSDLRARFMGTMLTKIEYKIKKGLQYLSIEH